MAPPGRCPSPSDRPMERVLYEVKKVIVGQDHLLERMVVALLARGHLLVEGVPGLAKTMAIKTLAAVDRRRVQADPVHAGPRAGRPRRHAHLQPEDRRVQHLARPGLHQPAARRRDQPRAGQGPERAARGDAGAPGHDRARDVQGARPVPRPGHPEPDRDRGHLRAARGPGRPVHAQGPGRLPERDRGVRHRRADDRPARARSSRSSRPTTCWRSSAQADQVYVDPALIDYAVRLATATRTPQDLRAARARALHHVRREPARLDQPDPHGPGPRLHPRPRPTRSPRTSWTWPAT